MALPFLPYEHMQPAFDELAHSATEGRMVELVAYIRNNWMHSTLWGPTELSAFMQAVRTNNDVEGWHRRLNVRALHGQLPLYLLITMLRREAAMVNIHAQMVSDRKLCRIQSKKYKSVQGKVFKAWGEYSAGNTTTSALLRACSHLVEPAPAAPPRLCD